MTKALLKTSEVAALLSCTDREVRNLCESGAIRAGKLGTSWRVHPDDLDAYVQKLRGITKPAAVSAIADGQKARAS